MNLSILCVLCLAVAACTPQTARAQKQADQALEATQKLLRDFQAYYGELTPEQAEQFKTLVFQTDKLVTSARRSLAPALKLLARNKPIEVDTTVEEALESTDTFVQKAMVQSARAEVEVESILTWHNTIKNWVYSNASTLTTTFGTGGIGLLLLSAFGKLVQVHLRDKKVQETLASGSVLLSKATTVHEEELVKEALEAEQQRAGIHKYVVKTLDKAKHASKTKKQSG
jgi:hypothetical protein